MTQVQSILGQDRSFDGTGEPTVDIVKFNTDVSSDFEYYMPRISKIFLDKEGNFKALTAQVHLTTSSKC